MEKTIKLTESSDLFNKINALALPHSEHVEVIDALQAANKVTAAMYWLVTKCRQLSAWLNPHPKFKPE